jgi:vitamin B12/bleomycin/antimicrobial peptide transport system ATP-binding/permease protein
MSMAAPVRSSAAATPRASPSPSSPERVESQSIRRFWRTARGFLTGGAGWWPWALIGLLVAGVVLQLLVQYRLNLWNRDFFNALEQKDGGVMWQQAEILLLLAALSVGLAIVAVWGRMTFQRKWRQWLTPLLISLWAGDASWRRLFEPGDELEFAEYRIAEDARIATDAPIDFMVGLLASVLTAATFITVLWTVGGSIDLSLLGLGTRIPGYLVIAVVIYSALTTAAMMLIGGRMAAVIERKNEAESLLKSAVARLREDLQREYAGETARPDSGLVATVASAMDKVAAEWRRLCSQHMRTTLVSHGNTLLAPLIGLVLCVPNYVHGSMTLGEMTQSAAAFVAVQSAFNWLVDNYPRLAEWASSSSRVGVLLLRLDRSGPISVSKR